MMRTMRVTIAQAAVLAMLAVGAPARPQESPLASPTKPIAVAAHPVATSIATPAASSLMPGTIINAENADHYASFIPAATMLAIHHGLRLEVMPTHRIPWS